MGMARNRKHGQPLVTHKKVRFGPVGSPKTLSRSCLQTPSCLNFIR
jgi:hypothetical protein